MARHRLPPLASLRAFEATARLMSFRAAGDELCVTHSAVSHQIKRLERELGAPLFWRKGRRVELTEGGLALYPVLHDAFARIGEAAERVRAAGAAGELTLQVYVTVASRWLLPRLPRFEAAHPDLRLKLSTSHWSWDFDAEKADVGLIYREPPLDPRHRWWPLFRADLVAVASPSADLTRPRRLRVDTAEADWTRWLEAAGPAALPDREGPTVDSYLLALEAAIDGHGLALVPDFLAAPDLETGRLVEPYPSSRVAQAGGWYIVCRPERRSDRRIARLRDWLVAEFRADGRT